MAYYYPITPLTSNLLKAGMYETVCFNETKGRMYVYQECSGQLRYIKTPDNKNEETTKI